MSMTIITGPTIVNPDTLETVADLRRALHLANETLLSQFACIAKVDEAGQQVATAMEGVLSAHMQNDAITVAGRLDAYLSARPRLREHLEQQIESASSRKVH